MSLEYAENRIKEALRLAKGNTTRARQQIMAWTYEDAKLLHALTRPHLTGIVAHAVNRVIYRQHEEEKAVLPDVPQPLDMEPETFGMEILKVLQNDKTPRFGRESSAAPVRRPRASKKHIDALNRIAGKGKSEDDKI
jgi:hypothetical protein